MYLAMCFGMAPVQEVMIIRSGGVPSALPWLWGMREEDEVVWTGIVGRWGIEAQLVSSFLSWR